MRVLLTVFIFLFATSLFGHNLQKQISSTQDINYPYSERKLMVFKKFSDSIIRLALKKKFLQYRINKTILKDDQLKRLDDYISPNDLKEKISYNFNLTSPDSRYSFELIFYECKSDSLAINSLNIQATIAYAAEFGLIKAPVSVFRIGKYIIWLAAPNTLSGRTFNALNKKLKSQFPKNELDELEGHIKHKSSSKLEDESLMGSWKLKFICPLYQKDSIPKKTYENITIKVEKEVVKLDSLEFKIDRLNKVQIPDAQTFLSNFQQIEPQQINSKLKENKGSLILYDITFNNHLSFQNNKPNYELFNTKSLVSKFIRFSNNEFGLIADKAYYLLIKND